MSGYIPAALDAVGEDINPFRASSRPSTKGEEMLSSAAGTVADWLSPVTSRLVYAGRVAEVASLGIGDVLRRRLGTALVIAGAVISLAVGVILGGAGSSVSASLPGVQSSSTNNTSAKDWGELRTNISSGTTGSSSGKSQAPNTPASAGSVVGGGSSSLLAGGNTAGPLATVPNSSSSGSHAQSPAATTPAASSSGGNSTPPPSGGSVAGSGTKPTTTPTTTSGGSSPTTTKPTTTTTKPPTTTTTTSPPPTTTTTQPPPPTTTPTTAPCSPLNHFLNIC
ncbi:MAG TPA: hypothetical protein VHU85_05900 [Acidimicrobiales bacterium]|jgi:hypothetical protein|nr:hypothetical protein [Acidimicrobiales bacterium]